MARSDIPDSLPPEKPKFCVDCRHYDPGHHGFDHCRHPAAMLPGAPVNLVTGRPGEPFYRWPETMRSSHGDCGPDAKLFEPKTPPGFV